MLVSNRLAASALQEPFSGILPNGFQQPVARVPIILLYHHQAFVAERSQQI